jgi:hypothetical protein
MDCIFRVIPAKRPIISPRVSALFLIRLPGDPFDDSAAQLWPGWSAHCQDILIIKSA